MLTIHNTIAICTQFLAPKFLNKGERGGHEFTAWSNTSYVKFITPFDIHTQILDTKNVQEYKLLQLLPSYFKIRQD